MFQKGDRVICINNSTDIPNVAEGSAQYREDVELGKVYIVTDFGSRGDSMQIRKEGTSRTTKWYVPVSAFVLAHPVKIKSKVGDYVLLPSTLPSYWSDDMSQFLNKVVRITKIYQIVENDYFEFEGSKPYFFDPTCILKSYTEQEYLQYLEFRKESPQNINDIYEIAKEVYGEDRVEIDRNGIIIYFPHIHITNGRQKKGHDIHDLFVRIGVNLDLDKGAANLDIDGKRMSYTLDELASAYCHSHLSFNGCQWGNFCLGSSQFRIMQTNMLSPKGSTNVSWRLMFYSIPKYLEWESLDGGPYKSIENIVSFDKDSNISFDFHKHKSIFKELPLDLLDATSLGISINNATAFSNFIKEKSPIKSLKKDSSIRAKELTKSYYDNYGKAYITFKGKKMPFKVIEQKIENKEQTEVSSDVVSLFKNNFINVYNNFNTELNTNYAKDKFYSKLFGQAGVKQ